MGIQRIEPDGEVGTVELERSQREERDGVCRDRRVELGRREEFGSQPSQA